MLSDILKDLLNSSIPGALFSMLIPLLFLVVMIKDKHARYTLLYFCWGLVSVIFAYLLNGWFSLKTDLSSSISTDIAPIIEEILKLLPLLLFLRKRNIYDNLVIY